MKKQLFLSFLVFVGILLPGKAQRIKTASLKFPTNNAVWQLKKSSHTLDFWWRYSTENLDLSLKGQHKTGDIIYNELYKNSELIGGLRTNGERVWATFDFQTENLLYDFSINVGDTVLHGCILKNYPSNFRRKDWQYCSVLKNKIGKCYYMEILMQPTSSKNEWKHYATDLWIEGMGSTNGLLYAWYIYANSYLETEYTESIYRQQDFYKTTSFTVDHQQIYPNLETEVFPERIFPCKDASWKIKKNTSTYQDNGSWINNSYTLQMEYRGTMQGSNTKSYGKLYENDKFLGGLRYENKKVWITHTGEEEFLLYDFGAHKGDTIRHGNIFPNDYYPYYSVVKDIKEGENGKEIQVDCYMGNISEPFGDDTWIEGAGSTYGILKMWSIYPIAVGHSTYNYSVTELSMDGKLYYLYNNSSPFYGSTYYSIPETEVSYSAYYNNISSILTIDLPETIYPCTLYLFNTTGKELSNERLTTSASIDLSTIPNGVYAGIIMKGKNNVGKFKFIKKEI